MFIKHNSVPSRHLFFLPAPILIPVPFKICEGKIVSPVSSLMETCLFLLLSNPLVYS
jgi:hypothetical protein